MRVPGRFNISKFYRGEVFLLLPIEAETARAILNAGTAICAEEIFFAAIRVVFEGGGEIFVGGGEIPDECRCIQTMYDGVENEYDYVVSEDVVQGCC